MNKIFQKLLLLTVMAVLCVPSVMATVPKREFRSVWFTTVWAIDWPSTRGVGASVQAAQKAELIKYLDQLQGMRMNAVFFQVRSMSDAFYKSSYEPWSSYLTDSRGTEPGWDPLAFAVEECHKRGLECHAWVNPYRFSTGTDWNAPQDVELKNSGNLLRHENTIIWNPAYEASRNRIVNVCKEIVTNYKVDGIVFDDYFYPNGIPSNANAQDYTDWQKSGTTMNIGDWRRANVNLMVKNVYDMIQSTRPDVRFGISPAGIAGASASQHGVKKCPVGHDWQYNGIFSDPLAWLEEGTIDYISPQIYWLTTSEGQPFGPVTEWWGYVANHFKRHHYASHSVSILANNDTEEYWADFAQQVEFSRTTTLNNAPGSVYYSTKNINGPGASGLGNYLKANKYQQSSLAPVITWKTGAKYGKVNNLFLNGQTLAWDAVKNGNAIVKYTVYAIPYLTPKDEIMNADGDGIANKYLLGVAYNNSFEVPANTLKECWYAVCVYDGYGNEYEYATAAYPTEESVKPRLISPVNDQVTDWTTTFKWEAANNAIYTFELSDNADFKNILFVERGLAQPQYELFIETLKSSTKYFWRIKTVEKGKLESTSAAATFTTKKKADAPIVALKYPVNNAETTTDYIDFTWTKKDVLHYVVEVYNTADLTKAVYTKEIANPQSGNEVVHSVPATILGKGNYQWRVMSRALCMESTYSAYGKFAVKSYDMGSHEEGYFAKPDGAEYEDVEKVQISSLWTRTQSNDDENIMFTDDGIYNQGMVAVGNELYVVGRMEDSADAEVYVYRMNGLNGEILETITVAPEVQCLTYPGNDIIKDSEGNLCIVNLSIAITGSPLKIYQLNLKDGSVTLRAEIKLSGRGASRVDFVSITGNVETGNFTVFAPFASNKKVYRWVYTNGVKGKNEICNLKAVYPAEEKNLGKAPFIMALNANEFYVDGNLTALTKYSFKDGQILDSFAENEEMQPKSMNLNGGAMFKLNSKYFMAYPMTDFSHPNGHTFQIASSDANYSFKSLKGMWTVPANGLGKIENGISVADVEVAHINESTAIVYVYVPGNGIAAYKLVDTEGAGVEGVEGDNGMEIYTYRNVVSFGSEVQTAEIYSVSGAIVARAENVTEMTLDVVPGTYIVKAACDSKVATKVVVIE